MAEGLTKDEIERGIKKLVKLGDNTTNKEEDIKTNYGNPLSPTDARKVKLTSPDSSNSQSWKRNKRKKKKNEKDNNSTEHAHGQDNEKLKHTPTAKSKERHPDREKPNRKKYPPQSNNAEVLKPGLIISVNEDSKRSISAYLVENKDSMPDTKEKEKREINSNLVTVDAKGNYVSENLKSVDDSGKISKKRKKKGKKAVSESSDGEDDKETCCVVQNIQKSVDKKDDQKIVAASKKFLDSNSGEKTRGHKQEKSGHEADDEKGPNDDLNLDLRDIDEDISNEVLLQILERSRIFPLKKKSVRFPRARFFCRVCEYHMDTLDDVKRHGKDNRHQRRVENINVQDELKKISSPTENQITALDKLLEEIYHNQHLSESLVNERETVVRNLEMFLKKIIPDVKLQIFGSTMSGLGLVTSDVNIDLEVGKDHSKCLTVAFKVMRESDEYQNVISDFTSRVPCIYFNVKNVQYRITISSDTSRNTSQLLKLYGSCDQRFVKLAVIFRYWAKICKIDRQDEGTLPAYSFSLLVVFYLQRCKPPVLPVLYKGMDDIGNTSPTKNKPVIKPEVDFDEIAEIASEWKSENTESIGSLWVGLFRYYTLGFEMNAHVVCIRQLDICTRAQKKWNSRKLAIEDPFALKRNVSKSVAGFELFEYIWDCVRKSYCYFGQPTNYKELRKHSPRHKTKSQTLNKPSIGGASPDLTSAHKKNMGDIFKKSRNKEDTKITSCAVGIKDKVTESLNIDEKDVLEEVESIDVKVESGENSAIDSKQCDSNEKSNICDSENKNPEVLKAVSENTISNIKQNHYNNYDHDSKQENDLNRSVKTSDSLTCLAKCIVDGVLETAIASLSLTENAVSIDECENKQDSAVLSLDYGEKEQSQSTSMVSEDSSGISHTKQEENVLLDKNGESKVSHDGVVDSCEEKAQSGNLNSTECAKESTFIDNQEADTSQRHNLVSVQERAPGENTGKTLGHVSDSTEDQGDIHGNEQMKTSTEQYDYLFQFSVVTDGKGPPVFCTLCEKEGHLKNSCPDEKLPELVPLPEMTKSHKEMLGSLLKRMPREFGPTENELREREFVRMEFEEFIQELYQDARVHLFGSSHNGFGFSQSDLDLCVTFDKHPTGDGLDMVHFIECISSKLKTHRGLYNVFPITTAKVPIVKFRHRRSQLEGDISMYNLLALQNTQMVRMYALIDNRVRILGYALKVFVKQCDIGDASRGSLSSYAYTLMLIHYLQQCKPPILPVLQELYHHYGPDKPELMIDGWNAWYFDNMKALSDVWLDYGKNNQSVAELWIGLFRYYTEEFNIKEQVICCRQTSMLTKFEKLWNSPCIAIEDPFDLNHNLGGGLSRKMHQFIHKAFIRGRALYGNPRPDLGAEWKLLFGYFFASERLNDGPPPNDRCCRACNKIGHIAKDCPVVKNRKGREEKEKKKKAEQKSREEERKKHQHNNVNNCNDRVDQSPLNQKVFYRTVSESNDMRYESQPVSISPGRRSMSVPSNYHQGHGHFSPLSSPQAYQGCQQNVGPLNSPQPSYSRSPQSSGVFRTLFKQQQQVRTSPGRAGGYHYNVPSHQPSAEMSNMSGGHQMPGYHSHSQGWPRSSNGQHIPVSHQPSPDGSASNRHQKQNMQNDQRRGNGSVNVQSQRGQNSMFRQAEQYYKRGQKQ